MSSGFAMSDDFELPPPAYEASQQELDRKISTALEASLTTSSSLRAIAEDEWEVWDDAAFAAATTAQNQNQSGSGPSSTQNIGQQHVAPASVLPLHVKKKSVGNASDVLPKDQPTVHTEVPVNPVESSSPATPRLPNPYPSSNPPSPLSSPPSHTASHRMPPPFAAARSPVTNIGNTGEKERPSWFEEAGLGNGYSSPPSQPSTSSGLTPRQQAPAVRHEFSEGADEERSPPPPFTAIGPSLVGPPSEEVLTTYPGNNLNSSLPPPPLGSISSSVATDTPNRSQSLYRARPTPLRQHHQSLPPPHSHLSLPPPSRETAHQGARPSRAQSAQYQYHQQGPGPRMDFNHTIAYRKQAIEETHHKPIPVSVNATSFYNSAVIGHMTSIEKPPVPTRHYPTNSPTYQPMQGAHDPPPEQHSSQSPVFDNQAYVPAHYPQQQHYPTNHAPPGPIPHSSPMSQYPPHPGYNQRWN